VPARILVEVELDFRDKTLAQIEVELMDRLRAALGPAFQAELAQVAAAAPLGRCDRCGLARRRRGKEKRIVVGLFGRLELERSRASCGGCGDNAYPADQALGLDPGEHYSLGVAEAALWLATESSYQKSAASVAPLLAVEISHGQVHRLAQREGALVQATWETWRRQVFGAGDRQQLTELESNREPKDLVVVQADGTYVHERGRGDRMEAKGGIVYSKPVTVSKNRRRLLDKQTYAGVEGVDAFGEKLALLAARQGAYQAKQLFFVSDGSTILRQMRAAHFPTAVYFLDVWHLEYRLAAALGEAGRDDLPPLVSLALEGKVDALIARLSELWAAASQDDDRRRHLGEVIAYVDSNREGIANYARYGPRASGAIEKAMDVTIGRRLKAKGTSWFQPGAHHLLQLRTLKQNGRWSRYWAARRARTSLLDALAA